MKRLRTRENWGRAVLTALIILAADVTSRPAFAVPAFDSQSNGEDGPLDLTSKPNGSYDFNPADYTPRTDNVYRFSYINIPIGRELYLSTKKMPNLPVFFLVKDYVYIQGRIYLIGENGHPAGTSLVNRQPARPGPGGFPGGVGGNVAQPNWGGGPAQPGAGPGAGTAPPTSHDYCGRGGTFTGNRFLVPLIGGSGAGGGFYTAATMIVAGGGGGGGGAILISSGANIQIYTPGGVFAYGGYGNQSGAYYGGGGAGGAIRLVAPILYGEGYLQVHGGASGGCGGRPWSGGSGRVRLEAFQHNETYNITSPSDNVPVLSIGSPLKNFLPTAPRPAIWVESIAGIAVPPNPSGSFEVPTTDADVPISSGTAVPVVIKAKNIPVSGTKVLLHIFSLEASDQVLQDTLPPLMGTFNDSGLTVNVTFPPGFSRGYVRASWQP